jgi:hypothetical protein
MMMREFDASYVLRVWKDGKGQDAWRASLKNLKSQETELFRNLSDLAIHLKGQLTYEHEDSNE